MTLRKRQGTVSTGLAWNNPGTGELSGRAGFLPIRHTHNRKPLLAPAYPPRLGPFLWAAHTSPRADSRNAAGASPLVGVPSSDRGIGMTDRRFYLLLTLLVLTLTAGEIVYAMVGPLSEATHQVDELSSVNRVR